MTFLEIINRSKTGQADAQRQLFDSTCDHLLSVALRYVLDKSSAEDVLQETYIRIFQSLKKFEYINDAATMGWMRQITATESIRYLKKNKRWQFAASQTTTKAQEPNDNFFEDEFYNLLIALPHRQRIVFNMYAIEGYSHKEISIFLGIAESSSRSLLTRARAFLQSQIVKNDSYAKV